MFSDILTPLPAMGIDFTIVEGKVKEATAATISELVFYLHFRMYNFIVGPKNTK
jgi:hypothetical protein